ncbi:hypothetical protein CEXT_303281 [Caerostris extrusa]|uniref:Methyltransferase type 11 domain-containing protein n=1 Tax=Caerostris extrusa TaxID=172846 RepID=A0AAV4QLT3_CAEEX|nr:hypothetical protein CEXT_303281 [Caerostris extrusa]
MTTALFTGAKHAQIYAKFRPSPPASLISSIITYLEQKINPPFKKAVDIGCGSGQSTIALSPYFETILGLDVSEAQIKQAEELHSSQNIEYQVAKGENLPVSSDSVDLITFSQSLHWFNKNEIFPEIKRVLKPNGVVAAYGYWIPVPKFDDEDKSNRINHLITKKLGSYWDKERYIVQNHYADINLPFKDSHRLSLVQKTSSSLADYMGYLSSWSSYQKLFKEDSEAAEQLLEEIEKKFLAILRKEKSPEELILGLYTDFFMIIAHK